MHSFYAKEEYQEIADIFNLGHISKIAHFHGGYQTPKVAVDTRKGKFVIARHNLSNKRTVVADMKIVPRIALIQEINFLNTLKGLPTPKYIRSKNKKYLESFKNNAVSVYKFLPGQHPKKITPQMAYQLGMFVGGFHREGNKFNKPMKGRRRFYDLNPKVLELMSKYAKRQTNPKLKAAFEEIKAGVVKNRLPKFLPRGPIHVDIKPDNELFTGEKLSGVIDFGNVYIDPFIFDVGKTIMWNCVRGTRIDKNLEKKFLEGYSKKRKLNKEEINNLNRSVLFAIYSHLWVDLYHVPIKYVPESYTLFLVKTFLPVARNLERDLSSA